MSIPLEPGHYYHVYNRAVGNEKLFTHADDYLAFFKRMKKYLVPAMDFYAYCLLPNHFHFLIQTRPEPFPFSKAFSDCLNSFTKWRKQKYDRMGGLFMMPFSRKQITNEAYLRQAVWYIHLNPLHHHYCEDVADWHWSSYKTLISGQVTLLQREAVLDWFGGREHFMDFHREWQHGYWEELEPGL